MTTAGSRGALLLLPPCASTGIGSLPHTQLELAMQMALRVDVPYLPQLPSGNPAELMIPAALEGLPGLRFDAEGQCVVELQDWEKGRAAFDQRLAGALSAERTGLPDFEPSPIAVRAWRPFLFEVEHRKLAFVKLQLAGPTTSRWVVTTSEGKPASDVPALDQQIFQLVMARSLAMIRALKSVSNATPLFFLDEPGLYALEMKNPRHLLVIQELKVLIMSLQREGALVGVHCCGNTDWPAIFDLGSDVVSLDVRLSLDAALEDPLAFLRFLMRGATLGLGIVPTDLATEFRVKELVESVEATLRATLPRPNALPDVLGRMLLTPACGLAMRTVSAAEQIFDQVRDAQKALRAVGTPGASVSPSEVAPLLA